MKDTVIYNPSEEVSGIKKFYPNQYKKVDSIRILKSNSWLKGDKTIYYMKDEQFSNQPDYTSIPTLLGFIAFWTLVIILIYKLFNNIVRIRKNTDKIREHIESNK